MDIARAAALSVPCLKFLELSGRGLKPASLSLFKALLELLLQLVELCQIRLELFFVF